MHKYAFSWQEVFNILWLNQYQISSILHSARNLQKDMRHSCAPALCVDFYQELHSNWMNFVYRLLFLLAKLCWGLNAHISKLTRAWRLIKADVHRSSWHRADCWNCLVLDLSALFHCGPRGRGVFGLLWCEQTKRNREQISELPWRAARDLRTICGFLSAVAGPKVWWKNCAKGLCHKTSAVPLQKTMTARHSVPHHVCLKVLVELSGTHFIY